MQHVNEKLLEKQNEAVSCWIKNGGNGIIQWPTGTGKTNIAILIIQRLNKNLPNGEIHVVVPNANLKEDWTGNKFKKGHIENRGLLNVKVFVINTYIKKERVCDLLILDEYHRAAANTFIKLMQTTSRRFFLGLTATLERLDNRHTLLLKYGKIVHTLNENDAKNNGFISEYKIFNLGLDLTESDKEKYALIDLEFKKRFKAFNYDFDLAMKCATSLNPKWVPANPVLGQSGHWEHCMAAKFCIQEGFAVDSLESVVDRYKFNKQVKEHNKIVKTRAEKLKVKKLYENIFHPFYNPVVINITAIRWMQYMAIRKRFIYRLESKLPILSEINEKIGGKIITFSEDSEFADKVLSYLPNCTIYHTKIPAKQRRINLYKFETGEYTHISSVKALNEGMNVEGITCTVNLSQTRSTIASNQKRGRANRIDYTNPNKCAVHINIYIEDFYYKNEKILSQEKKTIIKNQEKLTEVFYVRSVDEIVQQLNDVSFNNNNDDDNVISQKTELI